MTDTKPKERPIEQMADMQAVKFGDTIMGALTGVGVAGFLCAAGLALMSTPATAA